MSELGNYGAQAELYQALINDEVLQSFIDNRFYNRVAEQDADFPRLVYTQLNDSDSKHADDKAVKATVYFQISIFSDAETIIHETQIYKEIERVMKSLEYGKYDYQPFYEADTGIHHLALRYEKNFYGGNEE